MRIWTLAALLAVALLIGACGGDEDGGGGEAEKEYLAQAEQICQESAEASRDSALEIGVPLTLDDVIAQTEARLEIAKGNLGSLQAIEAPADDDTFAEYVSLAEERIPLVEKQIDAYKNGDEVDQQKAVDAVSKISDEQDALAEDLGLEVCGDYLPEDQIADAEDVAREFATTNDPATSCDPDNPDALVLDALVESFGGPKECEALQKQLEGNLATDIEITEPTTGTPGVVAFVHSEDVGGKYDGQETTFTLYYVDGEWRVWNAALQS